MEEKNVPDQYLTDNANRASVPATNHSPDAPQAVEKELLKEVNHNAEVPKFKKKSGARPTPVKSQPETPAFDTAPNTLGSPAADAKDQGKDGRKQSIGATTSSGIGMATQAAAGVLTSINKPVKDQDVSKGQADEITCEE